MRPYVFTVLLLGASNVFMTFAWYAHLKELSGRPWVVAALASWGIALFEYLLQVPANRVGHGVMSVAQLKILQEAITLPVFVARPQGGAAARKRCVPQARSFAGGLDGA